MKISDRLFQLEKRVLENETTLMDLEKVIQWLWQKEKERSK